MKVSFNTMIQIAGVYMTAGNKGKEDAQKTQVPFSAFFTFDASNPVPVFNDGMMIDETFDSTRIKIKIVTFDQKAGSLVFTRSSQLSSLFFIPETFDLHLLGNFYQGHIYRNDQIFGIVQCQVTEIPREVITFHETAFIALDVYSSKV